MFDQTTAPWGKWTGWVSAAAKAIVTYIPSYIRHGLHAQGSALENATSNRPTLEYKTAEKVYRINDGGRVLKRSLRQDEYSITDNGEAIVPLLVVERLKNETECMRFIKEHTDIPVPKVLDTYEEHGSYHLWMEFIDGVEMNELTDEEQSKIFPQIHSIVANLQSLRSRLSGGPTGTLSPPSMVYFYHLSSWEQRSSHKEEFVFCHCDLSQSNILVDPKTLQIVAIIDWEYGGFFPRELEIPFYECSEASGQQVKGNRFKPAVDKIIEFWRQSQTSVI